VGEETDFILCETWDLAASRGEGVSGNFLGGGHGPLGPETSKDPTEVSCQSHTSRRGGVEERNTYDEIWEGGPSSRPYKLSKGALHLNEERTIYNTRKKGKDKEYSRYDCLLHLSIVRAWGKVIIRISKNQLTL